MYKLLLAASALFLGLTLTAPANAHESGHHGGGHGGVSKPYYHDHGVHFSGGYYYRGIDHHHWKRRVWDTHYCRWQYYDTDCGCYYYWDAARDCYYPIGY